MTATTVGLLVAALVLALMPAGIASAVVDTSAVCEDAPDFGFADADRIAEVHRANVDCMAAFGITVGVDDVPNFAPGANVTRQQMALFIARMLTQAENGDTVIPEAADGPFEDLDRGVPEAQRNAINWLFERGITTGVTPTTYDPGGNVTRQAMASFIARAHLELGVDPSVFDQAIADFEGEPFTDLDDIAEVHRGNVLALQALGIVTGFADGSYGPGLPVTRQAMAAFVMRSAPVLDSVGLWNGRFIDPIVMATLSGIVADVSEVAPTVPGTPLPEARVSLFAGEVVSGEPTATTTADTDGVYEFEVRTGTYTLTAVNAEGAAQFLGPAVTVEVTADTNLDLGLFPISDVLPPVDPEMVMTTTTSSSDVTMVDFDEIGGFWRIPVRVEDGMSQTTLNATDAEAIVLRWPDGTDLRLGAAGAAASHWSRAGCEGLPGPYTYDEGDYALFYRFEGNWVRLDVSFDADSCLMAVNGDPYPPASG